MNCSCQRRCRLATNGSGIKTMFKPHCIFVVLDMRFSSLFYKIIQKEKKTITLFLLTCMPSKQMCLHLESIETRIEFAAKMV